MRPLFKIASAGFGLALSHALRGRYGAITGISASSSSKLLHPHPLPRLPARTFGSDCCCNDNFMDSRIPGFMYKDHIPPNSVDWLKKGAVTKPHKQMAEDCWAHSAVGATEGINAITTGKLIKLSEQQVLDCNNLSNGFYGNGHGHTHLALDYIFRNGGIAPDALYPYDGKQGPCREINCEMVTIDGYQFVPRNCEYSLRQAAANQPICVDICFDEGLEDYRGGIADDMGSCRELNHSVLLIAYGQTSKGRKFWRIKDSATGKLIYIARDVGSKGGAFGIAKNACFPVKISPNCDGCVKDDISTYVKMYGKNEL